MVLEHKFRCTVVGLLFLFTGNCLADDAADWLTHFYDSRGVCVSSASITDILVQDETIIVQLESDKEYLGRVKKGGHRILQDWLALHCPLPTIAYAKTLKGKDVIVKVDGVDALSCSAFEKSRQLP